MEDAIQKMNGYGYAGNLEILYRFTYITSFNIRSNNEKYFCLYVIFTQI